MNRSVIGRHIVADPRICHGKPTFRGTRILVSSVLQMVAADMPWDEIVKEWRSDVTMEAISEAVQLASAALEDHAREYLPEPASA